MKRMISILFIVLYCLTPLWAETQLQLNQQACEELKKTDQDLNKTYQRILSKYQDDKVFIKQLITAQKKWMEFRDAYVASMYIPQYKDSYGSILPMCECYFIENITKDRVKQLRVWLDGIDEGDACVGSVLNN